MPLPVTALYAALLGVILLALGALAGSARGKAGVSLGDGGNATLVEAMRRQANFVEYVPMILVMMAVIELNGAPKTWLHGLGSVLVACRILHPFGLSAKSMASPLRIVGAAGTFLTLTAAVLILAWQAVT